jgi:hypothetical protein
MLCKKLYVFKYCIYAYQILHTFMKSQPKFLNYIFWIHHYILEQFVLSFIIDIIRNDFLERLINIESLINSHVLFLNKLINKFKKNNAKK